MACKKTSTNSVTFDTFDRLVTWTATRANPDAVVTRDKGYRRSDVVRELIENHLTHVYRFAVYLVGDHHAAQDIAQEAMLRAWRERRQLRASPNGKAWLLRITANLCRDHQRRSRHPVSQAEPFNDEPDRMFADPCRPLVEAEAWANMEALIRSLSHRERTVLYLSAFEQLSNPEIAEATGLSAGAVKVALSRARKTVRMRLQEQENLG